MVVFEPIEHKYTSVDLKDQIEWTSVTSVLKHFKEPFDKELISNKSAANKRGKWYGKTAKEIKDIWEKEADRACTLGNYYHDQREADILECETINRYGEELPVVIPMVNEKGAKVAPDQKLGPGIYPEHLCYLRSIGVCGQSDLVEVAEGKVHITDYKTNKEIKKEGFTNWEGVTKKMLPPLSHLDDCNYNHYNIQLSIYMYIILKHNPNLKVGNIIVSHVLFEESGRDDNDYPITKLDVDGNPIIRDIVRYEMKYLKKEVVALMSFMKKLKKK